MKEGSPRNIQIKLANVIVSLRPMMKKKFPFQIKTKKCKSAAFSSYSVSSLAKLQLLLKMVKLFVCFVWIFLSLLVLFCFASVFSFVLSPPKPNLIHSSKRWIYIFICFVLFYFSFFLSCRLKSQNSFILSDCFVCGLWILTIQY